MPAVAKRLPPLFAAAVASSCTSTESDDAAARSVKRKAASSAKLVYTKNPNRPDQAVWIANADGSGARRLVVGRVAKLSPDGKQVLYTKCPRPRRPDVCRGLYVVGSAGGSGRLLHGGTTSGLWSPDSRHVAAVAGNRLLKIDVSTGRTTVLAAGGSFGGWSFSPSGDAIAYDQGRGGLASFDVYTISISGGKPRRITRGGSNVSPVWGARGIAFVHVAGEAPSGGEELRTVRADGSGIRRLVPPQAGIGVRPVAWSKDGRRLLATREEAGSARPLAIDASSGTARAIGGRRGFVLTFGLSRDGRWVLLQTGPTDSHLAQRVERVPFSGGRAEVLARSAGEPSWNV